MLPAGIYAIVDGSAARPPLDLVSAFVEGGAAVIQLRLKGHGSGELLRIAREARRMCSGRTTFLVNDRPDIALLAEADGVHLGQQDLPVAAARSILGSRAIVGLSTHSDEEIDGAEGADYIGFGPIFATSRKPGALLPPPHGIEGLRRATRRAPVPIVAIGGIGAANAGAVARAGARCAAAIASLCDATDPRGAVAEMRRAWESGR